MVVITLAVLGSLILVALLVRSMVDSMASWDVQGNSCNLPTPAPTTLPLLATTLGIDLSLLLFMLYGLFRRRDARRWGIWRLLWTQGVVWLVIAFVTEVPTVVGVFDR